MKKTKTIEDRNTFWSKTDLLDTIRLYKSVKIPKKSFQNKTGHLQKNIQREGTLNKQLLVIVISPKTAKKYKQKVKTIDFV